jgi:hypothetical protein
LAFLICSRNAADDLDACAALGEGFSSSASFFNTNGFGFGVLGFVSCAAGFGGEKTPANAGRGCCTLPDMVLLPRMGPRGVLFNEGVRGADLSIDLNALALVGDCALASFMVAAAWGFLLRVAVLLLACPLERGFAPIVEAVKEGIAGISASREFGRTPELWEDAGRDIGAIGLSGVKKLDFRRSLAGEGGIWASVSIARSDSDGRGPLCGFGVLGWSGDRS